MQSTLKRILLGGSLLYSAVTFSIDFDPKFYAGAEAQLYRYKVAKHIQDNEGDTIERDNQKPLFSQHNTGVAFFTGSRFNEWFGLEMGYAQSGNSKTQDSAQLLAPPGFTLTAVEVFKLQNRNLYIGGIGYMPVWQNVDLLGGIGVGRLSSKFQYNLQLLLNGNTVNTDSFTKNFTNVGIRLSGGLQYKCSDNISARFMLSHQKGNGLIKELTSGNIGLFYQF